MNKNTDLSTDTYDKCTDIENSEPELSPLKRNIVRIISAFLFFILIWGTVSATDFIMDFIIKMF